MVAGLFAPLLLMDMFEFHRILTGNKFWTISCLLYGFAAFICMESNKIIHSCVHGKKGLSAGSSTNESFSDGRIPHHRFIKP